MEYNQINEIFLKQNLEITLYPTDKKRKFKSFADFENFINAEVDTWKGIVNNEISSILPNFHAVQRFINQIKTTTDEPTTINLFGLINNHTKQPHTFISSETEEAQVILRLHKQNQIRGNAAYNILIQKVMVPVHQNIDYMMAAIECMRFLQKNEEKIIEKIEEENLEALKGRHHKTVTDIKSDYDKLRNDYLNELSKAKKEFESCNLTFTSQNDKNDKLFQSKLEEYQKKITELETTYGEKLRLSKPVDYWEKLEEDYLKKGRLWVSGAVVIGVILLIVLIFLLFNFPMWLKGAFGPDQLKGLIIFTLIISVFTYLLHLFVKLAISAYHLSRDAEERKQLTHVYLALLSEKGIDEKERAIVLQALFSRADTGLIKGDSSPTMPGLSSLLEKVTSSSSRK